MKTFIILILVASCQAFCQTNSDRSIANGAACEKWDQLYATLSPDSQRALERESVVRAKAQWLIRRDVVADCVLNLGIGSYFAKRVDTPHEYGEAERQFAQTHSKEIVEALRRLWPTLNAEKSSMRDGAFAEEKYELFNDPTLKESDLAPLIADLIDQSSVSREFATTLIDRPMIEVKSAVTRDLSKAEAKGDVAEQIYCLAVLQRMSDSLAPPKLKRLLNTPNLTDNETKVIDRLIMKAKSGHTIERSDIEGLEN